jgi:hypothetical protein
MSSCARGGWSRTAFITAVVLSAALVANCGGDTNGRHPEAEEGDCILACSNHGSCEWSDGEQTCDCDLGYAGDRCRECADGYERDAEGDCVQNGTSGTGGSAGSTAGEAGDSGTAGAGGVAMGGVATGGSGGTATGGRGGSGPSTWYGLVNATAQSTLEAEYDAWKSTYYRDCNNGSACVFDDTGGSCRSESIGCGMLLAVNMDDRDAFDKLWAYYQDHLDPNGIMDWETEVCSATLGENGGTNADLDTAMALIQADARWGGYGTDATNLVTAIRDHETDVCNSMTVLKPGDGFRDCPSNTTVNPSYFSPGYYRVFAAYVPSQADFWNDLVADTYVLYAQYQTEMDGLICGWADLDAGCTSGFDWNAVRAPWRVATDYAWFGDASAEQVLLNISGYVDSHGGIAGVAFDPNSALLGSLALSAIATHQTKFDTYVRDWLASVPADDIGYATMLRVMFLMLAAGEFPSTL